MTANNQILAKLLYLMADVHPFLSLLWKSNRKITVLLYLSVDNHSPHNLSIRHKICSSNYLPCSNIEKFYIYWQILSKKFLCKVFSPKISIIIERFKQKIPFLYYTVKSKDSHMIADLNHVQQNDISDLHKHCIPLDIPYLISPWWWVAWTTFIILVSKFLNASFSKRFLLSNLIIRTIIC